MRQAAAIHGVYHGLCLAADRTIQAYAKHPIHDDIATLQSSGGKRLGLDAGSGQPLSGYPGIARRQVTFIRPQYHRYQARLVRPARDHVAIATVVAGTAHHGDAARPRPAPAQ